jgi:YHS domain-containing protein
MALDPAAATAHEQFARHTYWFCSPACAEAFRHNPRLYVGARSPGADLRISDASRENATRILARAHARGRISDDELDERSAHALAARTRSELAAVLRDLPGYRRRRAAARWRRRVRSMLPWRPRS